MAMAKLKSLKDKVVIPSTAELYARRTSEIAAAKQELNKTVTAIVAAETLPNSQRRGYIELLSKRQVLRAKVERLQNEAELLKQQVIAARPKPPLSPRQQLMVDALPVPPPSPYTKEECAQAQAEVDAIVQQKRAAMWNPREVEALAPAYKEAKLKLDFLAGGYRGDWPACRPYGREDMNAALLKWKK
jgi:hypothetical protein